MQLLGGDSRHLRDRVLRSARRVVAAVVARVLRSRPLARSPLLIYRYGLGAVFGSRMLMLEHTGRRSGLVRRAVLEVVGRPAPGRFVVTSGLGEQAQWFRNVRADPRVRVTVAGRRAVPATATVLPTAEAARVLSDYVAANRALWAWFGPVLERTMGRAIDAGATPPPMVELVLDTAPTPRAGRPDGGRGSEAR